MIEIKLQIEWDRGESPFVDHRYSRRHLWRFDGGMQLPASASPEIVAEPMSDPSAVDPEEAFVAALSSCHMLWFLSIAAKQGFIVDHYLDEPMGKMETNSLGKFVVSVVTLRPVVSWGGDQKPSAEEVSHLHEVAHEACFLANSVLTRVVVEST